MAAIEPGAPAHAAPLAPRPRRGARPKAPFPYLNRELSWLEFNARVLFEAHDERNALLERVKFLAIFAGNLDEFFQVRIAGLRQQVEAGKVARSPDGRTAEEQLAAARERVLELVADHSAAYVSVRRALATEGIETRNGFYAASQLPIYPDCASLPICERLANNVISLPTFPSLDDRQINYVTSKLVALRK